MLVVDELKKHEPHLRLVAVMLVAGLCILLAGLWWVQVVSSREYQSHLETQQFRTIRLPAVRGKILDREGRVLAENQPRYNVSLYLDDLHQPFDAAYGELLKSARAVQKQNIANAEKKLGRSLTKAERKQFAFTTEQLQALRERARDGVASKLVAQVSQKMDQPLAFDAVLFNRHYASRLALPFPILKNLDASQIARFEESYTNRIGVEVELQSVRSYPLGDTAVHLLGYLQRHDDSQEGEDAVFNYRIPDFQGAVGVEYGFDDQLRGRAGAESLQVNSQGYRQSETIESQPEPGQNVVLTLDLDLQRAAEESLKNHRGPDARAAIVVMDVHNGDVLAMVSSPTINPLFFTGGLSPQETQAEAARRADIKMRPEINRATQENYAPGSIFKPIVGLAALEAGWDPNAVVDNPGFIYVGKRHITDLAKPGKYDFRRAIMDSSNTYFITAGLRAGIENIVQLAEKFQFGEKCSIPTRQETTGNMPTPDRIHECWSDGDTANVCIGQGEVAVTPLQMAVAYSAIANGGTVYWPRLVSRIEPQDPMSRGAVTNFPAGLVRERIGVSGRNLRILHNAMLAETEDPEGTGGLARVPGLHICGKTGTAEIMDEQNRKIGRTTWFASFAPYENPRYAVVVMVEDGTFGGPTCGPIAHDIYTAILEKEKSGAGKILATVY